jgi:orotidine-5'-phosphate decarboxylase
MTANPVFCALDTTDVGAAVALAGRLSPFVGGLKLGLEFFAANGPAGLRDVARGGLPIFLDLKLHDIPNTVAGAMRAIVPLAAAMTTLHAGGGLAMMRAARDAAGSEAARINVAPPKLLAVTVLTSLNGADLASQGIQSSPLDQAKRLAALAGEAGLDGVVCSPHEALALRRELGPDFILVVPGVRPSWADANDQKRVLTPAEALAAGADFLVIGRPITASADPAAAAARIMAELNR